MSKSMREKVAIVTGGGSGIGRACALAFARRGAAVVIGDLDGELAEETCRLIGAERGEACSVLIDVSRAADVEALVRYAVDRYGRLDFAHNNAGFVTPKRLTHEVLEDTWDQVMAINLKSIWLCMKYELCQMLTQEGGAIVNTASAAGLAGTVGLAAYAASKHGVVGLTKTAALEYAGRGIRVNAVCPGLTETPGADHWFASIAKTEGPDVKDRYAASMPMGRAGAPAEIAEAVTWLCSDEASMVTGLAMLVDGGKFAARPLS